MSEPLSVKINVTKILKDQMFTGTKGVYLDLMLWPNRDGIDAYGNSHYVVQSFSKEARANGVKGPILGNARPIQRAAASTEVKATPPPAGAEAPDKDDEDMQIPF
jgi:hypothetical protein